MNASTKSVIDVSSAVSELDSKQTSSDRAPRATIRLASFDDYPQIARVLERNSLKAKSREEWEHLWIENPAFQARPNWAIGWVAENERQEVVGYMGNIPVAYRFQGKDLSAATVCGLSMDQPYRGSAGFFLRRWLAQKAVDFLLITSANENSAKLNEAFRRGRVPVGNWAQSSYWITDHMNFAVSACKRKGLPKLAAYPMAQALWLQDRIAGSGRAQTAQHSEVTTCSNFDDRFDEFWKQLQLDYSDRFLADRSARCLQWHFAWPLAQRRVWIATIERNARVLAYAIFLRQDNPAIALRRLRLVDFQCLSGETQLLSPLLAWGLENCRRENIHTLESFACHPHKQQVIDTFKPRRRELPAWMFFYSASTAVMKAALPRAEHWDPSQYDGDASL